MKLQLKDAVDCLNLAFPEFDFLYLLDQSSGHTKKREDGLSSHSMNVELVQAPKMRRSKLFHGCIGGLFASTLHTAGKYGSLGGDNWQELVFPEASNCTPP
jgi:hypothetical protein